jgi:hypothetical protein
LGDLGGLTLKLSYLTTLAVMLICPVCKYNHQEEVSKCQRCNWSMQEDVDSIEINLEHPILATCIPTLVNRLEEETIHKEKLQLIIQQLELQESNSHKLDEILDEIETNKQQNYQAVTIIKDQIIELKSLLESKNNYSNLDTETTNSSTSIEDIQTLSENTSDDFNNENDSVFSIESDRNANNDYHPTNESQEGSLYDISDRESSENFQTQEYTAPENNSDGSYQSFYRLIKNRELEFTQVAIPQETMEKIRGGTQSEFKFVNDRKGNYWIINWHDIYCLIPKEKINIEEHNYGNFQRIFNCQNYQETYSDFEVIEPTIVFKSDNETWQLERKGKIKFI